MRLFIWQTLAKGLVTPWYRPYWSCYPPCLLYTKAYLISRTGLVQASSGFWQSTKGQPSLVRSSEARGWGKFRLGHFEASNPDATQGGGLLGRRGGAGAQESSGCVLGKISLTFSMQSSLGKDPGLSSQRRASRPGNRYTSGTSESKTQRAFSPRPHQLGDQVEGNGLPVLKYLTQS